MSVTQSAISKSDNPSVSQQQVSHFVSQMSHSITKYVNQSIIQSISQLICQLVSKYNQLVG